MTAKFPGTCKRCGSVILAGTEIKNHPKYGWSHPNCEPQVVQASEPQPKIAVEDAGVYLMPGGAIVKVKANKDKTRTYAERWTEIGGTRVTESGTHVNGEYRYEKGLVAQVAAEGRKMTMEEAKAFILKYGVCARCGRQLKAAKSVEQGIGPVCIKYFGGAVNGAALMAGPVHEGQPATTPDGGKTWVETPAYATASGVLMTGTGAFYSVTLALDNSPVAKFQTVGVNGKTPTDTALANLAHLSEQNEGKLALWVGGELPVSIVGAQLLAVAEAGIVLWTTL